MSFNRRRFIRLAGGTGVVLAASAVGLSRCDQMPSEAVAAWAGPGVDATDPRVRALSWALLAPNSHNLQPWIADLREPDVVTLFVDPARLLPQTDPFGRQIVVSHGCFMELMDLAARQEGYRLDISYLPDGETQGLEGIGEKPVARIRFIADKGVEKDPLFAQIARRRSIKEPFDMTRPISADHEAGFRAAHKDAGIALSLRREGAEVERIAGLAREAMLVELQTPRTLKESVDVTRVGAEEIAQHRDGIDLHGPMFWWLKRLGLMTPEKALTPGTMAYQGGIDYALGWANATPSFGWINTKGNGRAEQLAAGRAYVRLNLKAAEMGVAMHPVSQLLQEYAELTQLQKSFYEAAGAQAGETVQMLFRLGYAETTPPTPRRRLQDLIRA